MEKQTELTKLLLPMFHILQNRIIQSQLFMKIINFVSNI